MSFSDPEVHVAISAVAVRIGMSTDNTVAMQVVFSDNSTVLFEMSPEMALIVTADLAGVLEEITKGDNGQKSETN